jgi:hypothetical protein
MRFNAARYRRHLLQFTDAELIKAEKVVRPERFELPTLWFEA